MNGFMNWLETKFAPKLNRVSNNVWIVSIKNTMLQILPVILLASLFCLGAVLENYVSLPFSFWSLFGWTMGLLSVFVSFLLPLNFCERKRLRSSRIVAACAGLILYFITLKPELIEDGAPGFGHAAFGAGGMFSAIATGLFVCAVFNMFGHFSFFKEDSVIPDFVRQWFDALLPLGLIVLSGFVIVEIAGLNVYSIITSLFMPLKSVLNTWYGFIIMNFITCFIYSMGISTWVLTPVTEPVKLTSIAANISLVAAGTATINNLNLFTETAMFTAYMWWGGVACTFPLVLLLVRSKSVRLSALGKACMAPALFNINEPVIFGAVAFNPLLMVPMWIIGIVLPALTWIGTKVLAFAPIPTIQFDLWYTPYPISTWISSQGSITAIILVIIEFLVALAIWYPFFKVYEHQVLKEEENEQ